MGRVWNCGAPSACCDARAFCRKNERRTLYECSHILKSEGRDAAHGLIDSERARGRRCRALRAERAIAKPAVDANGGGIQGIKIEPLGIDEALCIFDLAAKPDPKARLDGTIWSERAAHRARNRKPLRAVGKLNHLRQNSSWLGESRVNVPKSAGAAEMSKGKAARRKPF